MKSYTKLIAAFTICTLIISSSANAQWIKSSGKLIKETRNVEKFESIKSAGSADVIITQGNTQEVIVESDANLLPYIKTTVKNGTLIIEIEKSYRYIEVIKVHITAPTLETIEISGSGDVEFTDVFKTNNLNIYTKGSGDLYATLEVKSLEYTVSGSGDATISGVNGIFKVSVSGSGDVVANNLRLSDCDIQLSGSGDLDLSGSTEDLVVSVAGSGDIDAYELQAVTVAASVVGSGDIHVYAIETINASIAGSGDIYYKGNPQKANVSTKGSGELIRR